MSKLLRKLSDEEVETSLSNGGRGAYCDFYIRMLPTYIALCAANAAGNGGGCGCDQMQYASEYIKKYC